METELVDEMKRAFQRVYKDKGKMVLCVMPEEDLIKLREEECKQTETYKQE